MLVNLYRSKTPVAIFSLPLIIGILASVIFFKETTDINYLFQWQESLFEMIRSNKLLNYLFTVSIVSVISSLVNNLFNRHGFYSKNTYLPGLIYALALATFNQMSFSPELFAHGFIVIGFNYLFRLRRQEDAKATIFYTSFFIGLASVFSLSVLPIIILPWIGLAVFRPFVWREWVMVLFGAILPNIYLLAILYMMNDEVWLSIRMTELLWSELEFSYVEGLLYTWFFLVSLIGLIRLLGIIRMQVVRFKKQTTILLHLLWISMVVFIVGWYFFDFLYVGLIIPLSLIISIYMLNAQMNLVVNIFTGAWFIICLVNILV